MQALEQQIAERMGRRYVRLVGRGTTALYVALRALALRDGPGEVILPDLICSTVLDAVLLAGFRPILADVVPGRFTLDPQDVRRKITPTTRAILVAHLFGHVVDLSDAGVPVIEDAVQGLGGTANGRPVGTLGTISFLSFHETKMIDGRGGAVLTDDEALWEAIRQVDLEALPPAPKDEPERYRHYRRQIDLPALIRAFDESPHNVDQIEAGWRRLEANAAERNEKAAQIHAALQGLPLLLPEIRPGDVIWRYTFAAPTRADTSWILRHLQAAGLSGSSLYPPLSTLFTPDAALFSQTLTRRLVNLWVDSSVSAAQLDQTMQVIRDWATARDRGSR